jgi:hypothetical protein
MVPIFPQGKFPGDATHLRLQWLMLTLQGAISRIVPEKGHCELFSSGLTREIYKATRSDSGYVGLIDRRWLDFVRLLLRRFDRFDQCQPLTRACWTQAPTPGLCQAAGCATVSPRNCFTDAIVVAALGVRNSGWCTGQLLYWSRAGRHGQGAEQTSTFMQSSAS